MQKDAEKTRAGAQQDPSLQETVPWDIMQGPTVYKSFELYCPEFCRS